MKSAFITGAATGIGEAMTVRLAREGWQVFAGFRRAAPELARWHGLPDVTTVPCDVTDPEQVLAAAKTVGAHTDGTLDLLMNNAGYSPHDGVIEAASMTEYRRAFEVNFWGPMHVVQAMTPLLRRSKGRIINTTSASVYITMPMYSAYPTSKAALKVMTQHLRMELAPFGIEVTSLEPGGVDTAMVEMGPDTEAAQWASIPEPLREQYRRHFVSGTTAIGNNFSFEPPDAFADAVWRKVISSKRLKPSYLVGPKVAALPWMHRLLSAHQVENIWRRMFCRKPGT
jgi:NAD(P)-dependent dehydrogenase (short-subunit alcohol dehydrogenase family)